MLKDFLKGLPEDPGVYIFWSKEKPIYVGKAVNVKKRVSSYFALNLYPKTKKMISEAERVSFIRVNSELEALLLEARLIKKHQPKYNFIAKDDKHPLYVKITREEFPRVITARKNEEKDNLAFFGPFPSSAKVYSVLRTIRKVIPFSDHKPGKRACIQSHIGLCSPCPSTINTDAGKNAYMANVLMVKDILSGKDKSVTENLQRIMREFSARENFEEAIAVRRKIEEIAYITQKPLPETLYLKNPNLAEDLRNRERKDLEKILGLSCRRLECFDVSHISGECAAASMVTFINAEPEKSYYRRFKIRNIKKGSDTDYLKEVAARRLKNLKKWGRPDVIVVDGGKAQVAAFSEITGSVNIPVIGIAKPFASLIVADKKVHMAKGPAKNLLLRLRDESHRFALKYHNLLIRRHLVTLYR